LLPKEQVILAFYKAFDYVGELIQQLEDSILNEKIQFGGEMMTKENIFYLMLDHMAHHRGISYPSFEDEWD
jgi:6-pyruvoyl-tetrahydropterin synthase